MVLNELKTSLPCGFVGPRQQTGGAPGRKVAITAAAGAGWSTGWLASPLDNSTLSAPTPIMLNPGITLTSGTLTIYPVSDQTAITVLSSNTTGTGQIGTLDPTTLNDGSYFIELRATNSQGVTQGNQVEVHVVGDYKPGRVTATVTDLVVPAPGLPIQIQRTYDSLTRGASSDFGYGWSLGVSLQVEVSPTADVTLTIAGRRRTFYFTPPPNGCSRTGTHRSTRPRESPPPSSRPGVAASP